MDDHGKELAKAKLMELNPENSTNIWDGLKVSYESLLKQSFEPDCVESVFLLTDGMPNMNPSRGYKHTVCSKLLVRLRNLVFFGDLQNIFLQK